MESLGIDLKLLLAQVFNFLVVMFILWKFAYPPILKMLGDRQNQIEEGLRCSDEAKKSLGNAESEAKEIRDKAYAEAEEIVKNAKAQASAEGSEILKKTNDQADRVLNSAKEEAAGLKEKTLKEAKSEIANVVTLALDKIIGEELDKQTKEKLTSKAIAEL